MAMNKQELIDFEAEVARRFEAGEIRGPIHLSGGKEDYLINLFDGIKNHDWVFSTWRSHYHALLHGIPKEQVMEQIMDSKSMLLNFPEHNFMTSAIVGGIIPIATGAAYALKDSSRHVWCFVGDMAASSGVMLDAIGFTEAHDLPITYVIEDNGLSCNTPTEKVTNALNFIIDSDYVMYYEYKREGPHCGTGNWVTF